MELYSNFLLVKYVVHGKKVVNGHEGCWEHIAVPCQESFKIFISHVSFVEVIKLHNIKVLFSMEKFVCVICNNRSILVTISIQLWEMVM